jgi:hypothetical protein
MDIKSIKIDKFICGDARSLAQREAQTALANMLKDENIGTSYADMMRDRISNQAANN